MKDVNLAIQISPDHRIGDPDSLPPWEILPIITNYVNHLTVPGAKSSVKSLVVVGLNAWKMTSQENKQPFSNRRFAVLSRSRSILYGCEVIKSPEEVFELRRPDETIWVLGGKSTFENFRDYANMVYFAKWDNLPKKSIFRVPEFSALEWDITGAGVASGCKTRVYSRNFW